jgi:uncharacterized coiled-coil protein SlyX
MEGHTSTNQENKFKIQKTSDFTFTLIKNSVTYLLTFKLKTQTLDIIVKRVMGFSNYEGIFTLDGLKALERVFYFYENLGEIYQDLLKKLDEEKVEFIEEEDKFNLKFDFSFESRKMQAVLKLNKINEGDLGKAIEDMGEVILNYSEFIKELHEKIANQNNKIAYQDEKISKQDEKIAILEENIKVLYNSFKGLQFSKIVKKEDIELIKKWIDEDNFNKVDFKLLYRATLHGKEAKDFHRRCDKKGSTITFIKTDNSRVFGGFTNLHWESRKSVTYKANDGQAFIFSIDHKKN